MGIYPRTILLDVNTGEALNSDRFRTRGAWYEQTDWMDGRITTRLVLAEEFLEERTTCYCCSCGDRAGSDPACRNHGFAGERPCEVHNMPGSPWADEIGDPDRIGAMPASVQEHLRTRGAA